MKAPTPARFTLGRCSITDAAMRVIAEPSNHTSAIELLAAHRDLDPGALSADGIAARLQAIEQGKRIFSLYEIAPGVLLRVITEADRSATVICTAEEF